MSSMDVMPYSLFTDQYKKKKEKYEDASAALLKLYEKKISAGFAAMMKEEGLCTYMDGLFTMVNPVKYELVLKEFGVHTDKTVPLVKSAFGDLFYFDGFECRILYTSHNENYSFATGDAVKYFFTFQLTDASFLTKNFKKRLFGQALKEYGPLKPDETYGFEPALPLGGEEKLDNIKIVKTLEYLSILSQSF
eukprot:Unigene19111_Nuclearia_a/m.54270 Unigene19111_Nuclearia_a/g.54270  ORF Unigene19111_Nuclearia_a/g.54270 Unigene19111_Nuclearia_a/m.54270 type:complete len:192 (+) Unigene19111_Nuclearia_a:271-846(+)